MEKKLKISGRILLATSLAIGGCGVASGSYLSVSRQKVTDNAQALVDADKIWRQTHEAIDRASGISVETKIDLREKNDYCLNILGNDCTDAAFETLYRPYADGPLNLASDACTEMDGLNKKFFTKSASGAFLADCHAKAIDLFDLTPPGMAYIDAENACRKKQIECHRAVLRIARGN